MTDYRWNQLDNARGYDRAAEHVHPFYREIQDVIVEALQEALRGWDARNVGQFSTPKVSGDDCHETADTQLGYFSDAGLVDGGILWRKRLWAVLAGRRA